MVAHQRESSLAQAGREQIFVTDGSIGSFSNNWVLRTSGSAARYAPQVRAAIATLGPRFLISQLKTMDDLVSDAQAAAATVAVSWVAKLSDARSNAIISYQMGSDLAGPRKE